MLGHFYKWWAPKLTCLNVQVKPGTGHCSTWVFCSLVFNSWLVKLVFKTGVKAGKNRSCSLWPKSHITFYSRKEKFSRLRISWNQHCSEYTEQCTRLSAHIHTWWKKELAAISHSVLNTCKQMLNQQDTSFCCQCFASCSLTLFLQQRCFSEETPWKPPCFLTPTRTLVK